MTTSQDLDRLARHVKQRREELGLPRLKAATDAGMSKDTWMRVERGASVRDLNYPKIDRVLLWAAGSCLTVAAGKEPVEIGADPLAPGVMGATVPVSDLGDEVRRSVESASIAVTDGLTAQQIRELSARVVADLKERGVLPEG